MDINEFKSRVASGNTEGCYLFAGEEDYLKKYYLGILRDSVVGDPTLAAFNHALFEGSDVSFAAVRDAIKAPPVFAERKLIEWRYPVFDKMREGDLTLFEETLELLREHSYSTLAIIVADGAVELGVGKRESKFEKRFRDKLSLLVFPKSTDAQLTSWLKRHFDSYGVSTDREALAELIFRSGHSMSVLNSEVDKLCFAALSRGSATVTAADVREIASSTPESDTFALSNAILDRNKAGAFLALEEMKLRRIDPLVILGMMAKSYSELLNVMMLDGDGKESADIATALGMNPYRLKLYLSASRRFTRERASRILAELVRVDTGAKFGGVTGYTAIELFIAKCV